MLSDISRGYVDRVLVCYLIYREARECVDGMIVCFWIYREAFPRNYLGDEAQRNPMLLAAESGALV